MNILDEEGITTVRLGIWRQKADDWVADGTFPTVSDAVRTALERMEHSPISPKTMARLESIARGLQLSVEACVIHLLDVRQRPIK